MFSNFQYETHSINIPTCHFINLHALLDRKNAIQAVAPNTLIEVMIAWQAKFFFDRLPLSLAAVFDIILHISAPLYVKNKVGVGTFDWSNSLLKKTERLLQLK